MADTVLIEPATTLAGALEVPGDKSISHRALLLGALAEGTSAVHGLSAGDDVTRTRHALVALGARMEPTGPTAWRITGGRARLRPAAEPLNCGNSGTTMRLLLGVLAGLDGTSVVAGDASLSSRPMDRVAEPLRRMGAAVEGRGDRCLPPVTVHGGSLRAITWAPPMASAQVKSCILLAGLSAAGETVVHEAVATRAHTEELLAEAGADVTVSAEGAGRTVRLRPSRLHPLDVHVPGDPSQAAFWVVAGCIVPGAEIHVGPVYGGPERTGFLAVLSRMGAPLDRHPGRHGLEIRSRYRELHGTEVAAAEIPSLDEVPILAVAAACATGTTVFRDVGELRVKESDRMAAVARLVQAFGARAEVHGDHLVVHGLGPRPLRAGAVDSARDHRIAMAGAVAALAAGEGPSTITGFGVVATSYPSFLADLSALGGRHR